LREDLPEFRARGDAVGRGRSAERAATAWLERQGYRILERNVRSRAGEIDCVALDPTGEADGTLCFIEIKARLDLRYGGALAAVNRRKRLRIVRCARLYLARSGWKGACRFDVLGLEPGSRGWRFRLVRGAFQAGE
jgi:putative endonuclease